MSDKVSLDEYLGFVQRASKDDRDSTPAESARDDGAYEDSWYQVLKRQSEGSEAS
jgi:hypothetical protein